jgi:hypothetical protein
MPFILIEISKLGFYCYFNSYGTILASPIPFKLC